MNKENLRMQMLAGIITESQYKCMLNEVDNDGDFFLYHRTTIPKSKKILMSPSQKLTPGDGRAGIGTYFTYGNPEEISSVMDAYGGASLRYSIPRSTLSNFLIFDKNLQSKTLEQQLTPLKSVIGEDKFNESINSYSKGTLNQLEFIEELIKQDINLADYFDGALYGAKSQSSMGSALGLGASKSAGTNKTAVIYNQNLLNPQGISTDGVNYKMLSEPTDKIKSPEIALSQGEIPDGYTIKKTLVDLKGKNIFTLPDDLEIIGSLDLRNPSIENLPSNLKVKNTLYILPSQINSFLSTKPQIKRLWIDSLTQDIIKILTQSGLTYISQPWDKPEEDDYSGTFKV
jgi:hypothetical protein